MLNLFSGHSFRTPSPFLSDRTRKGSRGACARRRGRVAADRIYAIGADAHRSAAHCSRALAPACRARRIDHCRARDGGCRGTASRSGAQARARFFAGDFGAGRSGVQHHARLVHHAPRRSHAGVHARREAQAPNRCTSFLSKHYVNMHSEFMSCPFI